jgi:predicted enzyme related to lactoylglutathione lyase
VRSPIPRSRYEQRATRSPDRLHRILREERFSGQAILRSAFGWSFEDYGPDYASFADGRLSGGFQTATDVSPGGPLVVIYAADLEAMEQRVSQAGGTIVRPIFSFPGGRRFHFTDPSGNELSVWSDNEKREP